MIETILKKDLGRRSGKVLLSFDDGPNPQGGVTEHLLDVLRRQNVRAAFCVIGKHVAQSPSLVVQYRAEGHLLVNHGYAHRFCPALSSRRLADEIIKCDAALSSALDVDGFHASYFRPPYGMLRIGQEREIIGHGKTLACLSFFISDVRCTPSAFKNIIDALAARLIQRGGGAVVLHERLYSHPPADYFKRRASFNRSWIPEGVDRLVTRLRAAGLAFTDYNTGF